MIYNKRKRKKYIKKEKEKWKSGILWHICGWEIQSSKGILVFFSTISDYLFYIFSQDSISHISVFFRYWYPFPCSPYQPSLLIYLSYSHTTFFCMYGYIFFFHSHHHNHYWNKTIKRIWLLRYLLMVLELSFCTNFVILQIWVSHAILELGYIII